MTLNEAKQKVREYGFVLKYSDGEYEVHVPNNPNASYFTDDRDDAVSTARDMFNRRKNPKRTLPVIQKGDRVYLRSSKEQGSIERVDPYRYHAVVRWDDGERSQVYQTDIRKLMAKPKGRLPNVCGKKNAGAVKIYGRCLRIEAIKTVKHTYGGKTSTAGQKYFHDFSTQNAIIYGLPDGSLLIKSR